MFKNNVFNVSVDTKKWVKAALVRAAKTMAQTALTMITVGQAIFDVNWVNVLAVSATAGIISILTSVVGVPEVPAIKKEE
jgi:hypothetical protein